MVLEFVNTWSMKHPNVIDLLGVTDIEGPFSLVTPWMEHGTVLDCVSRLKGQPSLNAPLVEICNKWVRLLPDFCFSVVLNTEFLRLHR